MLVKDFITKEIPVLKSFDTGEYALSLMDELKLKHLPVLENHIYRCLVSEKDILLMPDLSDPIGEPVLFTPAVMENSPVYDALALVSRYGLSLLPVITVDGTYIGALTLDKLIEALSISCNAEAEGSVIALEMLPQDYTLTEIARIIESNNAHVLNLLSHTDEVTGRLLITLKVDLEDASPIIRSFERFNYTVLYHFMKKGMVDDVLQQRMNELMHYINM